MATSLADINTLARRDERRRELWRFWRNIVLAIAGVAAAVVVVVWLNWMLQRYYILSDDTARGERFRDGLVLTGIPARERDAYIDNQCKIAAISFYDHGIAGTGSPGAPPNEKAFLHACSGAMLGGKGGGGD